MVTAVRFRIVILGLVGMFFTLLVAPIANAAPVRTLIDRADDVKGPQIHLVYLVPSDGQDRNWDTNGQIKIWVDQSQTWLRGQAGKEFRYDTFNNELDISFLKSKMTIAEMTNSVDGKTYDSTLLPLLINEFLLQSPERKYSESPKTYIFVSGHSFKSGACGFANFYLGGIIWTGPRCWESSQDDRTDPYGMSWPARALIHEAIHTFGVSHVCDSTSDLMWGTPECTGNVTYGATLIDVNRDDYFGGEKAGTDISKLPIWNDAVLTSAYATLKPASANAPQLTNGDFVFVVGDTDSRITWDWARVGNTFRGGYNECTLTSGNLTITNTSTDGACNFEIPLTWRGGKIATVKNKVWIGPYMGETSTAIKLWNPDNRFSACTENFCFEKEVLSISSTYCYGTDYKFFTLEQFLDGAWKPITVAESRPTDRCKGTYWEPIPAEIEFTKAGSFIYRWSVGDTTLTNGSSEPARFLNILKSDAPYPVAKSKETLVATANLILDEVKAQDLREDLCTSSKGCYVGMPLMAPVICYVSDVGLMDLELFKDNTWQVIFTGPTKKGENNCGNSYSTPTFRTTFSEPGVQSFRWKATAGGKYSFTTTRYDIKIDVIPPSKSGTNPLATTQYATTKISALSEAVLKSRAEAAAKAKAEEDARLAAEAAAKAKAEEEARLKAEAEARAKAEAEAKARAEAEAQAKAQAQAEEAARLKAEAEAKAAAEAKARAEEEARLKAEAAAKSKKTTITCIKGKVTKKVTGVKPKCPTGFKLKK